MLTVKFEGIRNLRTFMIDSVKPLLNDEYDEEIGSMANKITGDYRVASVSFLQGANTQKKYIFALFDKDVDVGDTVLCDTATGYSVARIQSIGDKDSSVNPPTKEIICKVDFSDFNKRTEIRNKKKELMGRLSKLAEEDNKMNLYRELAKTNPDIENVLKQFEDISSYNC